MKKEIENRILKLTIKERDTFCLLLIGLDSFLNNNKLTKLSKREFITIIKNYVKEEVSFKINIYGVYSYRFLLDFKDSKKFLLIQSMNMTITTIDNNGQIIAGSLFEYKISLPESIVSLLIDAAHNNVRIGEGEKDLLALRYLYKPNEFKYQFVVGAGINIDYGLPKWSELEEDYKDSINSLFGKDIADKISEASFNANYGIFQIVKDIQYDKYKILLEKMANGYMDPLLSDNTILLAICKIMVYQSHRYNLSQTYLLTFNYDNLVEKALETLFKEDVGSLYKNSAAKWSANTFVILHPHGYLPKYGFFSKNDYDSVVLTTEEYFENYKTKSAYGYKTLYEHLDRTSTFIGNSITDYEEQKVIDEHFKHNPSQFHYWYGVIDDIKNIEAYLYKTIFLLKIGIIPLWYFSHDEYKEELMKYADGLNKPNILY